MNLIIVKPEEVADDGLVRLSDRRAEHIVAVLKANVGQTVRVGVLNGLMGMGVIEEVTAGAVRLRCTCQEAPKPQVPLDLICALPRPLVMKRLLAPLTTLGVRRIFFTNANKVERDYYDTHWLRPENYESLLIEGLEQAGDTVPPTITIVKQLKIFMEDRLDELFPTGLRILAHPTRAGEGPELSPGTLPVVLALGPEGGWTPYEVDLFTRYGFESLSLGPRILRTDIACIALISVLKYRLGLV